MKKTVSVTTQGIGRIRNQQFVAHPDMFPDVLLEPDGELPVSWPAELNLFHRAPGHLWTRHSRVRFLAQPGLVMLSPLGEGEEVVARAGRSRC